MERSATHQKANKYKHKVTPFTTYKPVPSNTIYLKKTVGLFGLTPAMQLNFDGMLPEYTRKKARDCS